MNHEIVIIRIRKSIKDLMNLNNQILIVEEEGEKMQSIGLDIILKAAEVINC